MKKLIFEYKEHIQNMLLPHMQRKLGFNKPPVINFEEDPENAKDLLGKTAFYDPAKMEITVYVTNRHPKDIMRSVAHEIVHHAQNCRGEFTDSSIAGEAGYAQKDSHLRKMEKEAYLSGNMIFRDWEDNYKKERKPNNMTMTEKLRQTIRSILKEELANLDGDAMFDSAAIPNEQTEHFVGDGCRVGDSSHMAYLRNKEGSHNLQGLSGNSDSPIFESKEKNISLKEWKNSELTKLLHNRFKISYPEVLTPLKPTKRVKK